MVITVKNFIDVSFEGVILSSFFYGYIITQMAGGWAALHYGGKKVLGIGVLATSVLTLLTPLAARLDFSCLVAVRVLQGLFQVGVKWF